MGLSLIHLPLCCYPHLWKPPVKYVYHLLRIGSRYSMGFLGMVDFFDAFPGGHLVGSRWIKMVDIFPTRNQEKREHITASKSRDTDEAWVELRT